MLIHTETTALKILENDLIEKVKLAYAEYPDIEVNVYGVFSLDHLETLEGSALGDRLAVGIGYTGCTPVDAERPTSADRSRSISMLAFRFIIILAVPSRDGEADYHDATTLLTIMRHKIIGSTVSEDRVQRTWQFVQEKPEISAATQSLLYYSQLWQIAMPNAGN